MSLGSRVTRRACSAQRLASSINLTIKSSEASCRAERALAWILFSLARPVISCMISRTSLWKGSFRIKSWSCFWKWAISLRARPPESAPAGSCKHTGLRSRRTGPSLVSPSVLASQLPRSRDECVEVALAAFFPCGGSLGRNGIPFLVGVPFCWVRPRGLLGPSHLPRGPGRKNKRTTFSQLHHLPDIFSPPPPPGGWFRFSNCN